MYILYWRLGSMVNKSWCQKDLCIASALKSCNIVQFLLLYFFIHQAHGMCILYSIFNFGPYDGCCPFLQHHRTLISPKCTVHFVHFKLYIFKKENKLQQSPVLHVYKWCIWAQLHCALSTYYSRTSSRG